MLHFFSGQRESRLEHALGVTAQIVTVFRFGMKDNRGLRVAFVAGMGRPEVEIRLLDRVPSKLGMQTS